MTKNRPLSGIVLAAGLAYATSGTAAVVIDFPDFSDVSGLTLNGDAAQVGNVLRVTPAIDGQSGSAFSTSSVSLASNASFSTFFQFRFTDPDLGFCDGLGCGADGLVFVVQTVGNNVGGAGGGIGYSGIPNSVGIEFDNWMNSFDDGSSNHVGIDVGGSVDSIVQAEITEADLNDGDVWNAWIDYNGASTELEVRLTRSATRPGSPILSLMRDLAADLGTTSAFVGFTSGTGASHANHDVLNWVLEDSFAPIGGGDDNGGDDGEVPVPTPLMLLGMGLTALALRRRS